MWEGFSRTEALLGSCGLKALQSAHVAIFGVGGVGSWCAEALARTGVGRLTLVDFDIVAESNINRQVQAQFHTVGLSKVVVLRERLLSLSPFIEVQAIAEMFSEKTVHMFPFASFTHVIDAIDIVAHKVFLICHAQSLGIPVFSSMGAAWRTDVSSIKIGRLADTYGCGLARVVRAGVRKAGGSLDVPCVFSPMVSMNKNFKTDSLVKGSLLPVTGTFGFMLAGLVINHIVQGASQDQDSVVSQEVFSKNL